MTATRTAGLFLLLTALATAISVPTRLLADADQPTLTESLLAIVANRGYYATGGAARFVSGITLLAAAWFLWRAMADYHWTAVGLAAGRRWTTSGLPYWPLKMWVLRFKWCTAGKRICVKISSAPLWRRL